MLLIIVRNGDVFSLCFYLPVLELLICSWLAKFKINIAIITRVQFSAFYLLTLSFCMISIRSKKHLSPCKSMDHSSNAKVIKNLRLINSSIQSIFNSKMHFFSFGQNTVEKQKTPSKIKCVINRYFTRK